MTLTDTSCSNILSKFNFGFKKSTQNRQSGVKTDVSNNTNVNTPNRDTSPNIPPQPNPAIHPLLAKPVAREENFVLLPHRDTVTKRKRDPNSPVRTSIKPKTRDEGLTEWNRYLSSYAEGRFNMSNPPEPPQNRPSGPLKAPIPTNDNDRVEALRQYYDVLRPGETPASPTSSTTRAQIDRFQRLVVLARQTFQTKIVLLSLVDEKRQFFKCEVGLGMSPETEREITFCGHTILSNEPMVVLNAEKDWRLSANPLVTGWPYIRFYAGAPIITPGGHAIGTICLVDNEPRDSFDVNQRRKLTEFARLAMDEIELAMRTRKNEARQEKADASKSVPAELRGMTAVASEAGQIDPAIAGKDVNKHLQAMDDQFDVVESAVTLAEKGGAAHLKFKYGRNTAVEIEAGSKEVEKAKRKVGDPKPQAKPVKVTHPTYWSSAKQTETAAPYVDSSKETRASKPAESRDSAGTDIRPSVREKSHLRQKSYESSNPRRTSDSEDSVNDLAVPFPRQHLSPTAKGLERKPPTTKDEKGKSMCPRTPAMPTYLELQTKSNPELAAQLIARALRVEFVYFMRLTPITAKSPNTTGYDHAEVNMEILGAYGLPFPSISFSPFTHLEALRSELGMIYYSNTPDDADATDDSISVAEDNFRVGIVVPVWREYPRSSLTSSAASMRARTSSSRGSAGKDESIGGSSTATSTTIASLRESCTKGVVVGVFSKRRERKTFTRIEREYLKEWASLRDHL